MEYCLAGSGETVLRSTYLWWLALCRFASYHAIPTKNKSGRELWFLVPKNLKFLKSSKISQSCGGKRERSQSKIAILTDSPGRSMDWSVHVDGSSGYREGSPRLLWVVLDVVKPTRDRGMVGTRYVELWRPVSWSLGLRKETDTESQSFPASAGSGRSVHGADVSL